MQLTKNQRDFILSLFENDKYPGWKNIAETLIDKGECIVPEQQGRPFSSIWIGGIGNFVHVSTSEIAVGCVTYKFDLDTLLHSLWFESAIDFKNKELEEKYTDISAKYSEMLTLKKDILTEKLHNLQSSQL